MKILYLILNQYQDIYSKGLVYSLLSLFISFIITRAIFLANNGGTAFPTCFIWDILLPINLKVSGKDCNFSRGRSIKSSCYCYCYISRFHSTPSPTIYRLRNMFLRKYFFPRIWRNQ